MTTYKIKSHWNATLNSLNGRVCETYEEALADIRSRAHGDVVSVEVDAGNKRSWQIYRSEEDAARDEYGDAPGLVIAVIETVTAPFREATDDDAAAG